MLNTILKGGVFRFLFLIVNFLVSLLLARFSGASDFGIISLIILNATIFQLITSLGADAAIVWHGAGKEFSKNQIFSLAAISAIFQFLIFALLGFISFSFFGKTLLARQSGSSFLVWEFLYFAGLVLIEKYLALFYARSRAVTANKVLLFIAIFFCFTLFLCLTGVIKNANPLSIFCCMIFLQGIGVCFVFHFRNRLIKLEGLSVIQLKAVLHFSAIVFFANLIQFLAYRIDFWILDYYYDKSEVGIYAQACQFAQLLWIVPRIFAALLIPAFRSEQNLVESNFLKLYRLLNIFSLLVLAATVAMAALLYGFYFQDEYSKGFLPLLIMLPGYFLFISVTLFSAYFSSKKLLWVNFINSSICMFIIVSLDFLLIPQFGIIGAAWANSIAYSFASVLMMVQFFYKTKFSIREIWQFKKTDFKLFQFLRS